MFFLFEMLLPSGTVYHIPIRIWLQLKYPKHPPCVSINPTGNMTIAQSPGYVSADGRITLSYLGTWKEVSWIRHFVERVGVARNGWYLSDLHLAKYHFEVSQLLQHAIMVFLCKGDQGMGRPTEFLKFVEGFTY